MNPIPHASIVEIWNEIAMMAKLGLKSEVIDILQCTA
jgi:hypothetical protein